MIEVTTSYHQGSQGLPMVNVKHHFWWDDIVSRYKDTTAHDLPLTPAFWDWAQELYDDAERHNWAQFHPIEACCELAREYGWTTAQMDAEEMFGDHVEIYSEGRSGGWLVVKGIGSPRDGEWDTEDAELWAKYEQYVRAIVDELDYYFVWYLFVNFYEPHMEEVKEHQDKMASIWLPWNVGATL